MNDGFDPKEHSLREVMEYTRHIPVRGLSIFLEKIVDEIEKLQQLDRKDAKLLWVNVRDSIPEIEERVLIYQKGGVFGGYEVDISYRTCEVYEYEEEDNNKIVWEGQGISNNIHWWMALPGSPPMESR